MGLLDRLLAPFRSSDDEDDVWDAIPSWQYDGRHVSSGGMARSEQEAAIADLQEQVEDEESDPPMDP